MKFKYKTTKGVPQGLSISNILANIYLLNFDDQIKNIGLKYFRYVDDILILLDEEETEEAQEILNNELKIIKLKINHSKTECSFAGNNFEYLGYKLSLPNVSIKDDNVNRFIKSVAAKFSSYKHNSLSQRSKCAWLTNNIQKHTFIEDLNEKITGAISDNRR